MAQSVKVINRLPMFSKSLYRVLNDAMRESSKDILINAKQKAPFRQGGLRSDANNREVEFLHHRVSFNKEYARFQEFGGDSKRKVRHYTTSGTGAHYLKKSGDAEVRKLKANFKKHAARARA